MKSLKCRKFERLMLLHVYGELDDSSEASLQRHARVCAACSNKLKEMQTLYMSIPISVEFEPRDDLIGRTKADCGKILTPPDAGPLPGRLFPRPVMAVLASIFVIFALVFIEYNRRDAEINFANDYEYEIIDRKLVEAENSFHALNMDISFLLGDF